MRTSALPELPASCRKSKSPATTCRRNPFPAGDRLGEAASRPSATRRENHSGSAMPPPGPGAAAPTRPESPARRARFATRLRRAGELGLRLVVPWGRLTDTATPAARPEESSPFGLGFQAPLRTIVEDAALGAEHSAPSSGFGPRPYRRPTGIQPEVEAGPKRRPLSPTAVTTPPFRRQPGEPLQICHRLPGAKRPCRLGRRLPHRAAALYSLRAFSISDAETKTA